MAFPKAYIEPERAMQLAVPYINRRATLRLEGATRLLLWLTLTCLASTFARAADAQRAVDASNHHPRRLIVAPRADRVQALDSFHRREGAKLQRQLEQAGSIQVLELDGRRPVQEAAARYAASGLVLFAEPDYLYSAAALPDDPRFQDGTQWWLNNYGQNAGLADADVDAPEAWNIWSNAETVIVAVIDTGVRHTHEDLASNLWVSPVNGKNGLDALNGTFDPWDDNGHGTHVAGIIGAVGNNGKGIAGMVWKTRLMICKFLGADANGYASDALACIEFARTNGAHVLNLSWGGGEYSAAMSNALWLARQDGIAISAAAGNNLADIDRSPYYPASFDLDNIVSVGASTRTDTLWALASYGALSVDLFAPGDSILSAASCTDSAYGSRNGSSMASACVAGALALLHSQSPAVSPAELRKRLIASADRKPAFAAKCVSGGRLNLRKAVDQPPIRVARGAGPVLQVTGVPSHSYLLESSTNLQTWSVLGTNRLTTGEWFYTNSNPAGQQFFRAAPAD